jgi:dihydropyrimidine dehydrogenase (NAD+) subunit PreA
VFTFEIEEVIAMGGNDDIELAVTLAGVKMRSSIGIGSIGTPLVNFKYLTPERHAEVLLGHVAAGAGYICLPAIMCVPDELLAALQAKAKPFNYDSGMPCPRFMRIETEGYGLEGLYFALSPGTAPAGSASAFPITQKMIDILKRQKPPNVPIIASVAGLGAFPETFVTCAKALEEAGVDLIELDMSCGLSTALEGALECYFEGSFPLYFAGSLVGDQPHLAESVTRAVAEAVNKPVGVKLSPETGYPRIVELARRVKDAGARFINCGGGAITIAPPDIYGHGKPIWPFMDGNPFVAGSGNYLRMTVYKQVAAIAKFAPGIDVVATGGLTVPQHTVEVMMLGAKATERVTALLYGGRQLIRKNIQFLTKYMKEQGYRSVNDFIGLGLEYIKPINKVDFMPGKVVAEVDHLICTGCMRCTDHVCLAMSADHGVARVKVDECLGCGMCVALCPEEAVRLREREG